MRIPKVNFFIIGAQKAGTTSIQYHLDQHPKISIPTNELHYFDQDLSKYDYDSTKSLIGVKTPSYSYIQKAIDEIYKYNPDAKLILSLRDPIYRAFSEWNMYKQVGLTNDSFFKTLEECKSLKLEQINKVGYHALQRGLYFDQISYILTKFRRDQLHIVISEKMKNNSAFEIENILSFLGVEPCDSINYSTTIHKRSYKLNMTSDEYSYLEDFYKEHNEKLFNFLGYQIDEWKN